MIFFDENVSRELFKSWFSDGFDKLLVKKTRFQTKKKRGNKNPKFGAPERAKMVVFEVMEWLQLAFFWEKIYSTSRELTYPTFGKGKSSSKTAFKREIC